jgi:putative ABC transport system substrate-binding protein
MMMRREFITLVGGAAAAWPVVAHAQKAMPVIGFLHAASLDAYANRLLAFHRGLKEVGYAEGENVTIEYRWADNQMDRLPAMAADLARRQIAVIVVSPSPVTVLAAKAVTNTIPVVFLVSEDPVKIGLVASLARPGGNLTGVNFFNLELAGKRLEVLHDLVPAATRIAVLINPANTGNADSTAQATETAGRAIGLQVQIIRASTGREIDAAFAAMARERPDALFVGGDPLFNSRRQQLALLAARHAIPAAYSSREYPESGGLMSYGADVTDAYRQLGLYAGRVLKGEKPANMPVIQSAKFELVINMQAARILGIAVPQSLQVAADELIE